jgi:hypothetical protein
MKPLLCDRRRVTLLIRLLPCRRVRFLGEQKVEKEVVVEPGQHDRDTAVWWISVDSDVIRLRVVSGGDTATPLRKSEV